MTKTRRKTATSTTASARCMSCPWTTRASNAVGAAAQHHDATGHVTRATQQLIVRYG